MGMMANTYPTWPYPQMPPPIHQWYYCSWPRNWMTLTQDVRYVYLFWRHRHYNYAQWFSPLWEKFGHAIPTYRDE